MLCSARKEHKSGTNAKERCSCKAWKLCSAGGQSDGYLQVAAGYEMGSKYTPSTSGKEPRIQFLRLPAARCVDLFSTLCGISNDHRMPIVARERLNSGRGGAAESINAAIPWLLLRAGIYFGKTGRCLVRDSSRKRRTHRNVESHGMCWLAVLMVGWHLQSQRNSVLNLGRLT